jgi:hypothetical protein
MSPLLIPALLWTLGPPSWHRPLAIAFTIVALCIAAVMLRHYRHGTAERRSDPLEQLGPHWPRRLSPAEYRPRLVAFLQLHGWRILSSTAAPSHVELVARMDRITLALVVLSPARKRPDDSDSERLMALQQRAATSHAALAAKRHSTPTMQREPPNIFKITMRDLENLPAAIGLETP